MNLIFNASAGTGKTWQVTGLYAALVLGREHEYLPSNRHPVTPEKILLMTFTDNAAAELRQRVSEKMIAAEKAALKSGDDETSDCARRVLRSLPVAHISTIHAFCAGLLREHALELGLSPSFQTLEEEARDAQLNEILKAEIFHCLENDPDFREFCAGISVLGDSDYSLINTVRSLLEKAASRGLDLSRAEALLPSPERTVTKQSFERIRDELARFDKLPAKAAGVFQTVEKILGNFPMFGNLENPPRPSLRSGHPSGGGERMKSPPLEGCPQGGEGLALIDSLAKFTGKGMKEISDALADLKERFLTETLYAENISTFQAFARCLAACARGFAEAKRSRDAVDFDDQLLLARDFLKNKNFGEPLFDWIIVDEVQDTSRVQCEVIEALWDKNTHLVICGDRKQSIYAWRSADPQVMSDLEAAMEQRGGLKQIALKQSYRSKDRVLKAVNELFSGIYEDYEKAALEPVADIGAVTGGEGPCVEFLMQDSDESTTDDEMSAVVRRIRLLMDGSEEWRPRFGRNGKTFVENEPFNYGDILILLKRSTHQDVLEKALRDAGIPYTSGGKGKALFEQMEVRDLLLFLQVLCEPSNDLALVGFLRSPFADLTDDEIVQLGWNGETFDHEILRKQFLESGHAAAERLLRYRVQTGEKLASQLIREIVRETAFDAQLAGQPGGEQKLANFKKALDWIRAAERGGQVLLPDVVRLFEKYIKNPPRSGAAEALLPDPSQNAVTIMTVHGAKGLTQRVCFVPDISFGDVTEPGFAMFSPNGTLEMNISGLSGEKVKSPGWDEAREAGKQVRNAELTNVFYVAMTRACDLVVFSGAGTKDPGGWLKQAEGFLESASVDILRRLAFSDIPVMEAMASEVRRQESGVRYVPLKVPAGMERKTVTSLVESQTSEGQTPQGEDRRAFGTLGHMVLEELAKSNWAGDISELAELFSAEVGPVETELLIKQLEATRKVLRKETAGAEQLLVEPPFVLRRNDILLDGTIDLLAQFPGCLKILDYKFTDKPPENAVNTYAPQLEAYREAIQKLHPGTEVQAALVLIAQRGTSVHPVG